MKAKSLMTLLLLTLVACSRNSDPVAPVVIDPARITAGTFAGFVELDTTRTAPRDTVAKGSIVRDAQGRPSVYTYTRWNPNTGDSIFWQRLRYTYAGAGDTVAALVLDSNRIINSGNFLTVRNLELTWNNGRLTRDTATYNQTGHSNRFSPRGNAWYYERRAKPVPAPSAAIAAFDFFYQTWNGADLLYQIDTLRYPTGPSGFQVQHDRTTVQSSYLVTDNPFHDIAKPVYWHCLADSFGVDFWRSAPRHLLQERTVSLARWTEFPAPTNPATTTRVLRYHYVFNTAGQPVRISELITGSQTQHRVLLLQYQ